MSGLESAIGRAAALRGRSNRQHGARPCYLMKIIHSRLQTYLRQGRGGKQPLRSVILKEASANVPAR